ncbi:hypothetical protein RvY_18103 [Ramazzottius varieornatus]|uniref:Uncharacterized protein n=1 Tax=Ramazzottius varieornatus TaxID=947166 RepID=A0A1D1W4P4_RAMVA|nr:hypothetical protein RvY_18103 [Ramazzottius varieornatus]
MSEPEAMFEVRRFHLDWSKREELFSYELMDELRVIDELLNMALRGVDWLGCCKHLWLIGRRTLQIVCASTGRPYSAAHAWSTQLSSVHRSTDSTSKIKRLIVLLLICMQNRLDSSLFIILGEFLENFALCGRRLSVLYFAGLHTVESTSTAAAMASAASKVKEQDRLEKAVAIVMKHAVTITEKKNDVPTMEGCVALFREHGQKWLDGYLEDSSLVKFSVIGWKMVVKSKRDADINSSTQMEGAVLQSLKEIADFQPKGATVDDLWSFFQAAYTMPESVDGLK